jgi:hypothetical protein
MTDQKPLAARIPDLIVTALAFTAAAAILTPVALVAVVPFVG